MQPKRLYEVKITKTILFVADDDRAAFSAGEAIGDDWTLDGETDTSVWAEVIDNDRRFLLDHELDVCPQGLADGDGRTVGELIAAGAIVIGGECE